MRALSYLLILFGLLSLFDAAYDEYRGVADALPPGRSITRYVIARAEDPKQFRNLMAYQWLRGPILLLGGIFILNICRRADRLDPFSPNFAGSDALDDLNRTLTEEEKRHHRPLE